MFISLTQLHIRSIWKIPALIKHSSRSTKQLKTSEGNLRAITTVRKMYALTITAWDSKEHMLAFKNTGAHKEAMKDIGRISDHYRSVNYESEKFPEWNEALVKLADTEFRYIKS